MYVGLGFRVHTCGKRGSPGSTPERRRSSEQRRCLRGMEEVDEAEEVDVEEVVVAEEVVEVVCPGSK